jgi:hypothetical protein
MPIRSQLFLVRDETIYKVAPEKKGVYAFYDPFAVLIYYGSTDNLQAAIFDHKNKKNNCTGNAYYFSFEENADPSSREKELLEEYQRLNKKLPLCNEVTS